MLPNRADLEGIMVAGQHVNWPLEPPQDIAYLLYYRSINTVVLERVSSDQDELGAVVPSNFDDSSRRLDARLTHQRAHGSGMGGFHSYLPVRSMQKLHRALLCGPAPCGANKLWSAAR